jgi:ubiquitin-like 1-activating enzyme E1 B
VWAKLLLSALFGPNEEANFLEDIRQELGDIVQNRDGKVLSYTVFSKVFDKDIHEQILLLQKKKEGKCEGLDEEQKKVIENLTDRKIVPIDTEKCKDMHDKTEYVDSEGNRTDTDVWEVDHYIQLFFSSVKQIVAEQADKIGSIEFDKDDEVLLDFVIAASNLRAHNYLISMESGFKIKEMAGNIVPAVSSTNGLVAGFESIEGLKVLAKQYDSLRSVTFSSNSDKRVITGTTIKDDINPNCVVCSNVSLQSKLTVDPDSFRLEDLLTKIFYKELAISSASIECNDNIIFESGDDLDEEDAEIFNAKLPKLLIDIGIADKSKIYVDDFSQSFN